MTNSLSFAPRVSRTNAADGTYRVKVNSPPTYTPPTGFTEL
jgi:hypothetical protein